MVNCLYFNTYTVMSEMVFGILGLLVLDSFMHIISCVPVCL
jgi:hypothetical protein